VSLELHSGGWKNTKYAKIQCIIPFLPDIPRGGLESASCLPSTRTLGAQQQKRKSAQQTAAIIFTENIEKRECSGKLSCDKEEKQAGFANSGTFFHIRG
jgi:hypothetical protein